MTTRKIAKNRKCSTKKTRRTTRRTIKRGGGGTKIHVDSDNNNFALRDIYRANETVQGVNPFREILRNIKNAKQASNAVEASKKGIKSINNNTTSPKSRKSRKSRSKKLVELDDVSSGDKVAVTHTFKFLKPKQLTVQEVNQTRENNAGTTNDKDYDILTLRTPRELFFATEDKKKQIKTVPVVHK